MNVSLFLSLFFSLVYDQQLLTYYLSKAMKFRKTITPNGLSF